MNKQEIIQDLKFCEILAGKLVEYAENSLTNDFLYNNHTVLEQDIIRLRRELNNVRLKLGGD